jgi:CRP-like cAMP-binding protein
MVINASPLARKLAQFVVFTADEQEALGKLQVSNTVVERHGELVSEGTSNSDCFIVHTGWAVCFKLLSDGRRQIVNVLLPGDLVGLRSLLLSLSDHSVIALTKLRVSRVSSDELGRTMSDHPRVAIAILWSMSRDEAIIVEHLVDIGRRNALQRLAHFILELGERLKHIDQASDEGYYCPLRQEDFADLLGLTTIHVNRSFRALRERQLTSLTQRNIRIYDRPSLVELAEFDDAYLNHRERPRFV